MHVKSLDHIHIYAADPDSSARFYIDHFDSQELVRNHNINGDLRIFLSLGDQVIVVGAFPSGIKPVSPPSVGDGAFCHGFGVAHFGLRVENVGRAVAQLSDAGVNVVGEVIRDGSGLTYSYIEAPDGVILELTEYA